MPDLTVPVPQFQFEEVVPGTASLEMPVEIHSDPISLQNGTEFSLENLGKAGFFIYRRHTPAATVEFWNEEQKQWEPDPGSLVVNQQPNAYAFYAGELPPWRAILVAAAGRDKDDAPQFQAKQLAGGPTYFFRSYFETTLGGVLYNGLSAPTPPIQFLPVLGTVRAGFDVGAGELPQNATEIKYFLRNANRQIIGWVKITNEEQTGKIEITNFDPFNNQQAKIELRPDGEITFNTSGVVNIYAAALRLNDQNVSTE
jgi:hypothetical protein